MNADLEQRDGGADVDTDAGEFTCEQVFRWIDALIVFGPIVVFILAGLVVLAIRHL